MTPQIDHVRQELAVLLSDYQTVEDFLAGPTRVRQMGERYLPWPEPILPGDTPKVAEQKKARYDAYLVRAIFIGLVKKTLTNLIGQVFAKETAISVPDSMLVIVNDADHAGTSLEMQAKKALEYGLGFGRGGLLTDYPNVLAGTQEEDSAATQAVVTVKQLQEQNLRPKIMLYNYRQIINWRVSTYGGRVLPSLIVLKEEVVADDDGFKETKVEQYRVLRLTAGVYSQELWVKSKTGNQAFDLDSTAVPVDSSGKTFDEIPFAPFGSESNTLEPDDIPLLDLVEIAKGLWHNSADYQENVFVMGQSTVWFSGLTEEWVKVAMKDGVRLGSRNAVLLPEGGSAGIISAEANGQVVESMKMLMEQAVTLGARLVEVGGKVKSATEDSNDEAASTSILSSSTNNVSSAYLKSLTWCARFMGIELPEDPNAEDALDFQLNTDFDISHMTSQERQVLLAEWQGGALTFGEYRWNLKQAGVAYEDDVKAKEAIDKEEEERIQKGLMGGATGDPGSQNKPPGNTDPAE
jgi:hypothetical protein